MTIIHVHSNTRISYQHNSVKISYTHSITFQYPLGSYPQYSHPPNQHSPCHESGLLQIVCWFSGSMLGSWEGKIKFFDTWNPNSLIAWITMFHHVSPCLQVFHGQSPCSHDSEIPNDFGYWSHHFWWNQVCRGPPRDLGCDGTIPGTLSLSFLLNFDVDLLHKFNNIYIYKYATKIYIYIYIII